MSAMALATLPVDVDGLAEIAEHLLAASLLSQRPYSMAALAYVCVLQKCSAMRCSLCIHACPGRSRPICGALFQH